MERLAFPFATGNGIGRKSGNRSTRITARKYLSRKSCKGIRELTVTLDCTRSSLRNELPLRIWLSFASASTSRPLFLVRGPPSFRLLVAVYVLDLHRLLMETDGLKNTYLEEVARRVVAGANEAEGENGDEKGRSLRLKRADVITIETHSDMLIRFEDSNNRLTPCSVRPRRAHTVFTIGWKLTKLRNALTFFRVAIAGRGTIG